MKKILLNMTAAALVFTSVTWAQEEEALIKDVMEVNFFGGAGIPNGDIKSYGDSAGAGSGYNVGLDAGYFITYNLVAGFNFTFTQFKVDKDAFADGLHHKLYSPNLYVKYYFTTESDWIPYVKAHAGVDFPKFATFVTNTGGNRFREISYDPIFAFGVGAGIFVYTSDFSGLFAEVKYHRALSSDTKADYQDNEYVFDNDLAMIDIHAGIRILIGPSQ
jgi:outer membrane protein W